MAASARAGRMAAKLEGNILRIALSGLLFFRVVLAV
jgi:hypothetical protein